MTGLEGSGEPSCMRFGYSWEQRCFSMPWEASLLLPRAQKGPCTGQGKDQEDVGSIPLPGAGMGMSLPFPTSPTGQHAVVSLWRAGTDGMYSRGCKSHQQGWGLPVTPFPLRQLLEASQNQRETSAASVSSHRRCCSHPGQAPAGSPRLLLHP